MPRLSLRARLTLWYTCLLLVILSVCAGAVLWQQGRIGLRRVDRELQSLSTTLANIIRDELHGDPDARSVAEEVCGTVASPGRAVAVLDARGDVLAARWNGLDLGRRPKMPAVSLTAWTAETPAGAWRIHVRRDTFSATELVLLVATPLSDLRREQREAEESMVVGIPLGLLLAAVGGLWLASVGLRPINEMIARLGAALRTQRQFMADASHELRTPVSVVRTATDVMLSREHRDESEYREALAIVGGQAGQLSRLVDDMLMLARADAGGLSLRPVDLYLDEVIEECRRTVDVLATERGVRIRGGSLQEIPFRGDEGLLRQLVTNVLQNAVQHTPSGGAVDVEAVEQAGSAIIRVTDSGPGIAAADQRRIFDRFVQLDPARRAQGSGLGLPIARWIAEAHGGTLVLERSGPGATTFCATLPSAAPSRP
jgi:signal transduction histidine kinase